MARGRRWNHLPSQVEGRWNTRPFMNISEFHKYNRLVRRQMVEPLSCPSCGNEFALRATTDGDPVLQCFVCNSLVQPGLKMYERLCAINSEFYKV